MSIRLKDGIVGNLSGNANTATTLQIARNIKIGNTSRSVNGSGDVTWSLGDIGAAASSHTHNYAGSSSAGGAATTALTCTGNSATATTSNYLASNSRMEYGWNGVNYFNISGTSGNAVKVNDTPSTAWWHIMRFNHANSTGYYTDLAIPFNDTSLYYKRITAGSVQNGGWVKVLDSLNYNSYAPTKTGGGASGTWGISINGNAATATKWSTGRWLTVGNAKKGVDGTGDVTWTLSEIGAAPTSHNHNSLTGVNSIAFASHETDSVSMGVLVDGTKSYMDFNLADDLDDMWRWRFKAFGSSTFNAMTLQALSETTSRLTVAGEVYNAGDIVTHNGTSALAYNLLRTSNSGTRNGQTWMTEILTTGRGTSYIGNRKVGTSKGYNGDNLNTRAAHIQLDYDDIIMGARISVKPYDPNGQSLGTSAYPWKEVYCTRGVFNGSDSKLKENIKKIENSKLVTYDSENDADTLTSNDLYEYVKNSSLYSFNYKNSDQNILGILADEIPENIFNKIGTIAEDENSIMDGIKLINASSQIAILQNVLGQTINRIEEQQQLLNTRDQEVSELKEELKLIKEKLGLQ